MPNPTSTCIALNHPVLHTVVPAYAEPLALAVERNDLISINHRLAAFFASYFDVIFALNRMLHLGEKRLIITAQERCSLLSAKMAEDIAAVLAAGGIGDPTLLAHVDGLLDRLDDLVDSEGFDIQLMQPTPIT